MKPIKLGKKYSGGCCPAPSNPSSDVHFPSVYLNAAKLGDIPEAGLITFRYELCRESTDHKQGTKDVSLDLLQIVDVQPDAKAKKKLTTEEELDKLAAEVTEEEDEKAPDRDSYVEDDES